MTDMMDLPEIPPRGVETVEALLPNEAGNWTRHLFWGTKPMVLKNHTGREFKTTGLLYCCQETGNIRLWGYLGEVA